MDICEGCDQQLGESLRELNEAAIGKNSYSRLAASRAGAATASGMLVCLVCGRVHCWCLSLSVLAGGNGMVPEMPFSFLHGAELSWVRIAEGLARGVARAAG